jgi:predicted HNH restriction endonuclease
MKICPKCKQEQSDDNFYLRSDRKNGQTHSYCRKCINAQTIKRQQQFKKQCIEYKGGKCSICGYDKCQASLEFHHLDPTEKDFCISTMKTTSYKKNREKMEKELDKCILVCANCHKEIHFKDLLGDPTPGVSDSPAE